jgi:hypothetical protein
LAGVSIHLIMTPTAAVEVKEMRANLEKIPIVKLLGVLIAVALVAAPDASAFRLNMEGGNSLRVETPAALYASDAAGHLVKIIARGAGVPGEGTIADFGIPAIAADGSVIFGADLRGEVVGWRIFRADPNASGGVRIAPALGNSEGTAACRPLLKSDPQPVATGVGSFVFIASDQFGRSALFSYSNGHLDCPVRTGDRTGEGHLISSLGFGTAPPPTAPSSSVAASFKVPTVAGGTTRKPQFCSLGPKGNRRRLQWKEVVPRTASAMAPASACPQFPTPQAAIWFRL